MDSSSSVDASAAKATKDKPTAPAAAANGAAKTEKTKDKRTTLSLHEKFIVKTYCEQQLNDTKTRGDFVPSHDALRQEIATKFGWEVGRSTLSKIMGMEWHQLPIHGHPNPNMKRKRKPLFPAFEEDLVKSVQEYVARQEETLPPPPATTLVGELENAMMAVKGTSAVLTEAIILEEAQRLKQVHGIKDDELVLSVGWLSRFKHRNGIRLRKPITTSRGYLATTEGLGGLSADTTAAARMDNDDAANKRMRTNESDQDVAASTRRQKNHEFHFVPDFTSQIDEGEVLLSTMFADLRSNCIAKTDDEDEEATSWSALVDAVPVEVRRLTCPHCTTSLPLGMEGLHIVVIGFKCVRDAFIAAALVGEHGSVTCIEACPEAASVAQAHSELYATKVLRYPVTNLYVLSGSSIEQGPSYSHRYNTRDLVLFNCSFHATAYKTQLLDTAFNLLKEGGECRVSYVSSSRRLRTEQHVLGAPRETSDASTQTILHELAATAVYEEDFRRMCQSIGFLDPRPLHTHTAIQCDSHPNVAFATTICRMFKLRLVEDRQEDYGERACYMGRAVVSIAGDSSAGTASPYRLDSQFLFSPNVSIPVDGNTAQILRMSWLKHMFTVEGDRLMHQGRFLHSAKATR